MLKTVLCVDLDGTLIYNDTLQGAIWVFIKSNPLRLFWFPLWLVTGRAYLKQQLVKRISLNVKNLPYNHHFIAWLKRQKAKGRKLILVTAMDKKMADAVAAHLAIFSEVLASNGKINLRAKAKAAALNQCYGKNNYDYAGNSRDDLAVWRDCRYAIVVNARSGILKRAQKIGNVVKVF